MWVVTDQCEVVVALRYPLMQAPLHVGGPADFEEELGARAAGGGSGAVGGVEEPGGVGGVSAGGADGRGRGREWGVGEPEHVDVPWLVLWGEGF